MLLPVTEDQFLAEYWQQKPLLCPRALPNFRSPFSAEELAGLAMEADVESRLVWQDAGAWQPTTGPPSQRSTFNVRGPWTLLVQGVDSWAPAVSALRNALPKIPRWRFDDVMVSFAHRRGRRRPAFRSLRCVPVAGNRAAGVAHRTTL